MSDKNLYEIRLDRLDQNKTHHFDVNLARDVLDTLVEELDLLKLEKFSASVDFTKDGATDWTMNGKLGASVTQACVVTGEPVKTRIDTSLSRRFVADFEAHEALNASETELDDEIEPLGESIKIQDIITEALALHIPDYPRKAGLDPVSVTAEPAGAEPMTEENTKPFASLAQLKDKLKKNE